VCESKAVPPDSHHWSGLEGDAVPILHVLNLSTKWKWVVSFMNRPHFTPEELSPYPLGKKMAEPQGRCELKTQQEKIVVPSLDRRCTDWFTQNYPHNLIYRLINSWYFYTLLFYRNWFVMSESKVTTTEAVIISTITVLELVGNLVTCSYLHRVVQMFRLWVVLSKLASVQGWGCILVCRETSLLLAFTGPNHHSTETCN
jgi:hypothetical protein